MFFSKRFQGLSLIFLAGLMVSARPAQGWVWNDKQSAVLPSLQEEFDQEATSYRGRVEKGMSLQERVIALDRLVSNYKPQGINTIVLESERDRLTLELDKDQRKSEGSQKVSTELYQLALQKTKEGRFSDSLSAVQKAERLSPDDKTLADLRRRLEGVAAILPSATQSNKVDSLVRKGITRYTENDGLRAVNALRYASQLNSSQASLSRLVKLLEKEYPDLNIPALPSDKTLVDYKLQLSLEYVYDGHYLKAVEECNQVLDMESSNVLALTRMGSVYYAMGQKSEAKKYWLQAMKLDPENQVIKRFLDEKF